MKLNADELARKYIVQLEQDLKLERERLKQARADLELYRGKCERLELAIMNQATAPAAVEFVRRSEPKKPSPNQIKLEGALRPMFSDLKKKWNAMTAEQQEKAVAEGWNVEEEAAK